MTPTTSMKHALMPTLTIPLAVLVLSLAIPRTALAVCAAVGASCATNECCNSDALCMGNCELVTSAYGCSANGDCISDSCSGANQCVPQDNLNWSCLTNADCGIYSQVIGGVLKHSQMVCFANQCVIEEGQPCANNMQCGSGGCGGGGTCDTSSAGSSCQTNSDCGIFSGTGAPLVCSRDDNAGSGNCWLAAGADCGAVANSYACASQSCVYSSGSYVCDKSANEGVCITSNDCAPDPWDNAFAQVCADSECAIQQGGACDTNHLLCVGDIGNAVGATCVAGFCSASASFMNGCGQDADCNANQQCMPLGGDNYTADLCLTTTGNSCTDDYECVTNHCVVTMGVGTCTCNGQTATTGVFGPCAGNADCCDTTFNYVCDNRADITEHMCLEQKLAGHNANCQGINLECWNDICTANVCTD